MSSLTFSPLPQIGSIQPGAHFVHFYEDNQSLIDSVFAYCDQGFEAGEVALVIATRGRRTALEQRFMEAGFDVPELQRSGKYAPFDAAEALGLFMHDGRPDPLRFKDLIGGLITTAGQYGSGVRAFGEMVAILWDEDNREGALELEHLWNDLAKEHAFTLFCAYRQNQFTTAADRAAHSTVCQAHSAVLGAL